MSPSFRLLLAAALTALAAGIAHGTRPDLSDRLLTFSYGGGTFSHRAPRIATDAVPPLSLTFRGPETAVLFTTVSLVWSGSAEGPLAVSPLTRLTVPGGAEYPAPSLPFDEGASVRYSFHVTGPEGEAEFPGAGQRLVVRMVGTGERARIRLHAGALLLGVFLAALGGTEGVAALRARRFDRRLAWIALGATGAFAIGAFASVGLAVNRGLGMDGPTRLVVLAGLWGAATALSLLASARERYLQPCALTCVIAAVLSTVLALIPHGLAA